MTWAEIVIAAFALLCLTSAVASVYWPLINPVWSRDTAFAADLAELGLKMADLNESIRELAELNVDALADFRERLDAIEECREWDRDARRDPIKMRPITKGV